MEVDFFRVLSNLLRRLVLAQIFAYLPEQGLLAVKLGLGAAVNAASSPLPLGKPDDIAAGSALRWISRLIVLGLQFKARAMARMLWCCCRSSSIAWRYVSLICSCVFLLMRPQLWKVLHFSFEVAGDADKNLDWFYVVSPRLSQYSRGGERAK